MIRPNACKNSKMGESSKSVRAQKFLLFTLPSVVHSHPFLTNAVFLFLQLNAQIVERCQEKIDNNESNLYNCKDICNNRRFEKEKWGELGVSKNARY